MSFLAVEMQHWMACGVIALLMLLAFVGGRRLSRGHYQRKPMLLVCTLLFSLLFTVGLGSHLALFSIIPSTATLALGNWLPVFLCFCAGVSCAAGYLGKLFRGSAAVTLVALSLVSLVGPLVRPILSPIELSVEAQWRNGVCLQSHSASCGPAAIATLLQQTDTQLGRASLGRVGSQLLDDQAGCERLLARACLTSEHGTLPQGLLGGLRWAVGDSGLDAFAADRDPMRWPAKQQLPNVAIVRFAGPDGGSGMPSFIGQTNEYHAIVVHRRLPDGRWIIADPAVGWVVWDDEMLHRRFTGNAIYLKQL